MRTETKKLKTIVATFNAVVDDPAAYPTAVAYLVDKRDALLEKQARSKQTSVYVLKCGDYYKIGIAYNVASRVNSIRVGNPYEVEVIMHHKVPAAKAVEKHLHSLFEHKRHKGEWFKLDNKDIELIRGIIVE